MLVCSGGTLGGAVILLERKWFELRLSTTNPRGEKLYLPQYILNVFKENWLSGLPEIPVTVQLDVYWPQNMLLWYQSKKVYDLSPTLLVLPEFSDSDLSFLCLGHSFFPCSFPLQYDCPALGGLVLQWIWFPDGFRMERLVQTHLLWLPQPSKEKDPPPGGSMETLAMLAAATLIFLVPLLWASALCHRQVTFLLDH